MFLSCRSRSIRTAAVAVLALVALSLPAGRAPAGPASQPSTHGEQKAAGHPASQPAEAPEAAELRAEVPELTAFHEVIFELWHTAWPEKNTALMKELLPRVKTDLETVRKAVLPGILRDKQEAWTKGLERMTAALAAYDRSASADDAPGLMAAVEELHAAFEAQMRIVRPAMKELDAYHVDLYQIYHHFLPGKKLEPLRASAAKMTGSCAALAGAAPPRWFKGEVEVLDKERQALCQETAGLVKVLEGTDWDAISVAVERVHTQYLAVEQAFK